MTYPNPEHRKDKEVKVRFNLHEHDRLKLIASNYKLQPAAFVRHLIESLLDDVDEGNTQTVDRLLESYSRRVFK